ncbi:MAG TPA: YggS family pyridoxal phosphate-dependent enzyme [Acidiferrobacteraceae bacterium]|nr:YggS family pyridoxal phosphate-dependent enzyme [Acidiferrobacteraceae bacterium]
MSYKPTSLADRLSILNQRIHDAEQRFGRVTGSVRLLAVGKTREAADLRVLASLGQKAFGENYLQEARFKMAALEDLSLCWHYIGRIQSNKTAQLAAQFDWIHSIDRLEIAQRLSEQRPHDVEPLNLCLQVNLDNETSKGGIPLPQVPQLAMEIAELPRLRLRGLMSVPRPETEFDAQRQQFTRLRHSLEDLNPLGLHLDTLSMGMSHDMEAAIAEGATIIRIGTALFGPRQR